MIALLNCSHDFWRRDDRRQFRMGFTLVELLVVIAIIGVLISVLLPAVQAARESARRASCQNNLKNQALALTMFHDTHRSYPPGHMYEGGLGYSWASYMLPFLEQRNTYDLIHFQLPWDSPENNIATRTSLPIFRCPSSWLVFDAKTDYGGVLGSIMSPPDSVVSGSLLNRGVLIIRESQQDVVTSAAITDGLSNTLCIAERCTVTEQEEGFWITGVTCMSHDRGSVNSDQSGIYSSHRTGAFAARSDGSVTYLSTSTAPTIIGALSTRNGQENIEF